MIDLNLVVSIHIPKEDIQYKDTLGPVIVFDSSLDQGTLYVRKESPEEACHEERGASLAIIAYSCGMREMYVVGFLEKLEVKAVEDQEVELRINDPELESRVIEFMENDWYTSFEIRTISDPVTIDHYLMLGPPNRMSPAATPNQLAPR
ncbi:hypothetical protein ACFL2V_14760 [Pseudomonadota bacterium]